jgi:DNA-binding NarL/FixJ family response regulator
MSKLNETIRVLIADDHPATRRGIRAILEEAQDIEVVGEAENGIEAQELIAKLRPDILLLDLVMPGLRPFEVERWVRTNYPNTVTLVLTAHDRDFYLAEAIKVGVAGFLIKEEKPQKLVDAIRRAAQGDILITKGQLDRVSSWHKEVGERWESLTQRERQVLVLLARGQNTQQIADALIVRESTVDTHISNILGKLNVDSRAEVVAWAWQHKVCEEISPSGDFS